jgi:hypothetical protein
MKMGIGRYRMQRATLIAENRAAFADLSATRHKLAQSTWLAREREVQAMGRLLHECSDHGVPDRFGLYVSG